MACHNSIQLIPTTAVVDESRSWVPVHVCPSWQMFAYLHHPIDVLMGRLRTVPRGKREKRLRIETLGMYSKDWSTYFVYFVEFLLLFGKLRVISDDAGLGPFVQTRSTKTSGRLVFDNDYHDPKPPNNQ